MVNGSIGARKPAMIFEIEWRPYRESNPGYLREREMS